MTVEARRSKVSLSEGYALCTPGGTILGHTYRQTENDAIVALFPLNERGYELWANAQADGWSAEHVYARIFSPRFFVDVTTGSPEHGPFNHREPGEYGEGMTAMNAGSRATRTTGGA